jgi:hypothetical protein
MAQSPPSPELVEAYNLIKAGQKQDAGRILKGYLTQHKDDPQAWWLMSHAASQPETVRRCLETVLKLDPDHAKARALLERMQQEAGAAVPAEKPETPPAPPPRAASQPARKPPAVPVTAPVPAPPAADDDFPDDALVLGGIGRAVPAAPPAPKAASPAREAAPPPAEAAPPASFEDYLSTSPDRDPFAGPPVDDPFALGRPPAAASEDLFAPSNVPSGSYNPFDSANVFDPAAHAKLGRPAAGETQAPGTGNQPEWGPGLAFVPDQTEPVSLEDDDDFDYERVKPRIERMIGIALVAFAIVVVGGLILWYLDSSGWVNLRGDSVPTLTRMDGGSFTIKYPKGWDKRCETDASGYPVCGIANHYLYNEVDYFAHQNIDLGAMLAGSISSMFTGDSAPEQRVSIIVMDVPRTSPSYDNGSWAKTSYEWSQSGWTWNPGAKINYDTKEITVDGHQGYYYEYSNEGSYREAAWDVYVEHDGIMLWMRVNYFGPRSKKIPRNTIQAMIESIKIKPTDAWTSVQP